MNHEDFFREHPRHPVINPGSVPGGSFGCIVLDFERRESRAALEMLRKIARLLCEHRL